MTTCLFHVAVAGVVIVTCTLGGCKEKSSGALTEFATRYSCPEEQVKVTARKDINPGTVLAPNFSKEPSEEVKNDPVRLAKFNDDQAKSKAQWAASYSDYDMFEVTGCGHTVIMGCHHPTGANGGTQTNLVTCRELDDGSKQRAKDEQKAEKRKEKDEERAAKRAAKEAKEEAKERARTANGSGAAQP